MAAGNIQGEMGVAWEIRRIRAFQTICNLIVTREKIKERIWVLFPLTYQML